MAEASFPQRFADGAWRVYHRLVLSRPARSLAALGFLCAFASYWIKDFRVDASGDTLVLEHDQDVRYHRAISSLYQNKDFIVITYTPPEDLFSASSLDRLKRLRSELRQLERVSSVVTLLDVPLLRNPPGELKDLKRNIKTLESPQADMKFAVEEFRRSPIYQNMLVGEAMKSAAIQVNFHADKEGLELVSRRSHLREKAYLKEITSAESEELKTLEIRYRLYKDDNGAKRKADLAEIRRIIASYSAEARFFLGGVPMIVQDIMTYVRSDMVIFGLAMLFFVVLTLYFIYRHMRWVVLPVACCVTAVLIMMGGMGFAHWDVTVVSSNFVSLQIILTMSFSIHLVSHYRELVWMRPKATNEELVTSTVREKFVPCLYTNFATIAGFDSLIFCDILPVTQFGWIMTLGLVVSMIIVFWLLPAAMLMMPRPAPREEDEWGAPVTFYFARVTERHRPLIYAVSLAMLGLTVLGVSRLEVENSFIGYFRDTTDIYRGMKFIDEELGGTTPLDIVVKLGSDKPDTEPVKSAPAASADDDFASFGEFEEKEKDPSKYWYTVSRLATIEKVHDYLDGLPETGKVLSLATLHKTASTLNGGKPFDDFSLALLYNTVSEQFKGFLVTPYVSLESDEARVTVRVKDSLQGLRRSELISRIRRDLVEKVGLREDQFRISGLMLLYNNMLQSLFSSQIKTLGSSMTALLIMFLLLFRSVKLALVGLLPQFLACISVLGIMGLGNIPLDVMTITVVSVAMGIGVEDAIHYIYRFQEEIEKDHDYVRAMYYCHLTIGNATFYTSLAVTAGFGILAFSNFVPTVLFGILTGVAMVVACVAAQTLLPALLLLTKPFGQGRTDLDAPRENARRLID